ncbi:MAG: NUDIX domain-containing protein [archaeon]
MKPKHGNGMRVLEYAGESGLMSPEARKRMIPQGLMSFESYKEAHANTVIACHDVMIQYDGGALLVKREGVPCKGMLWPVGGRISRGLSMEDSLRQKAKEECGLELSDLAFLDVTRVLLEEDPLGHGKGTDTIGFRYFAVGKGKIDLNHLHSDPVIIPPRDINADRMKAMGLHIYVADYLTMCLPYLKR